MERILSFKARLGRLATIEPRNPLSKWKKVFNAFVESDSNQLLGIDIFTPAYLFAKGRLLKGQSMVIWLVVWVGLTSDFSYAVNTKYEKDKAPQNNFLFSIIIVSKSKIILLVK